MIYIKNFIDSVAHMENRGKRDLVMHAQDARSMRDELAKLLAELYELRENVSKTQTIEVDVSGGKW